MVAVIVHVSRKEELWRQVQVSFHHLWPDKLLQVGPTQATVPVICNVTSIHDLTKKVAQVIIWHLGIRNRVVALQEGGCWCLAKVTCI